MKGKSHELAMLKFKNKAYHCKKVSLKINKIHQLVLQRLKCFQLNKLRITIKTFPYFKRNVTKIKKSLLSSSNWRYVMINYIQIRHLIWSQYSANRIAYWLINKQMIIKVITQYLIKPVQRWQGSTRINE